MREQVEALEAEYREVETRLANPTVIGDPVQLQAAGRRFKELEQVLAVGRPLSRAQDDLATARELVEEAEGDERELLRNEMADLEADIERLEGELRA
ncbi:MAG: PCRF domain-containing protein, partial [Actinomycetota bacterium]|nr:PCRF domain-containing protein [Actinomycetota bacterium]